MAEVTGNTDFLNGWDYADKHVDNDIEKDQFISSARCIIYAAPYKKVTASTAGGQSRESSQFHRIGVVQGYNWGENRQIDLIFELGSDIPYLVPGRTTGQISLSRVLLFGKDIANIMYYEGEVKPDESKLIRSIKDISKPFDLMFCAFDNQDKTKYFSRVFSGCWLSSRSESINAGQIIIAEHVSIMYENVIGVTFPK